MSVIFKIIRRIPLIGPIVDALNTYAFDGDLRAADTFAPFRLWISHFGLEVALSIYLAIIFSPEIAERVNMCGYYFLPLTINESTETIGKLVLAVFPNLLGFGIGAYALIFAVSKNMLSDMQEIFKKRKVGSVMLLNAEMAVPLVLMTVSILIAAVSEYLGGDFLGFLCWALFWLSLFFLFGLISTLYSLASAVISDALKN